MQVFSRDKFYPLYILFRHHLQNIYLFKCGQPFSKSRPGEEIHASPPMSSPKCESPENAVFEKVQSECSKKAHTLPGPRHSSLGPLSGRHLWLSLWPGERKAVYRASSWQSVGTHLENSGPLCTGSLSKTLLQNTVGGTLSQSNDLLLVAGGGLLFMFDFLNPSEAAKKA